MLFDLGYVSFTEPFSALLNQGMVLSGGSKMSKSKGGVNLGDEIEAHGVDAIRLTMAFAGPPDDDINWEDVSPAGSAKFLASAWRLAHDVKSAPEIDWKTGDVALRRVTHRFLAEAPGLVEAFKFNVVVARLMELVNATRKVIDAGPGAGDAAVREATETVALGLSLFAPYTAEEMWEKLGYPPPVALVRLAQGRPDPAGADRGDRGRAGRRQGARSARGHPEDRPGGAREARDGLRGRDAGHRRPLDRERDRAGAAHREHRDEGRLT